MNAEEIKDHYTMFDVLSMYGLEKPNRSGFIRCPFHREKTPSCRIRPKGFYCFGCNEKGDIFSFVMRMEHCSFKDAFLRLGGSYEGTTDEQREYFKQEKAERERQAQERLAKEVVLKHEKKDLFRKRKAWKELKADLELNDKNVFETLWCRCVNWILQTEIRIDEINEELEGGEYDGQGSDNIPSN